MDGRGNSSPESWRGDALELQLDVEDLDLVDKVLCLSSELRVVTFLGQELRRRGVRYPVDGPEQLQDLLGSDVFELAGHRIDRGSIGRAMARRWFPVVHEGELLSIICLALYRCRVEAVTARIAELNLDELVPSEVV
jgi:hypothetical protein